MRINNNINAQYASRNALQNKAKAKVNTNAKAEVRNNTAPSFKGGTEAFAGFYQKVAGSKPYQSFIKNFSKSDKTFTHLLVAESCILSSFYMINTLRNKKIDKEQKPQMLINDTLTWGVSTAGAYFAEDKITNAVMNGAEKYFTKHGDFYKDLGKKALEQQASTPKDNLLKQVADVASSKGGDLAKGIEEITTSMTKGLKNIIAEDGKTKAFQVSKEHMESVKEAVKNAVTDNAGHAEDAKNAVKGLVDDLYESSAAREQADKILPGFNKLKVLVIFGLIYRYLGPVVITPIANKISSKFFDKKSDEAKPEQAKPAEKK